MKRSEAFDTGGKWTPEQILEHDPAWLRKLGLELSPTDLWRPDGGGLLEAVVQFGGCSAAFVSADGLLMTNHHCAFALLQEHSTPEKDLIRDGFLARDRSEELMGISSRATVPFRFTDVTAEVEAAISQEADDYARYHALERKKKELVKRSEAKDFRRARVATYDDGVRYVLVETLEFRDLRLVYAPPREVGEFGGEVDNFCWPRHCGDVALVRVYADDSNQPANPGAKNRPYRPRRHLPIARDGVHEHDFVMITGYPATTYRSLIAEEMAEREELYFPRRAELYGDWANLLKSCMEEDEEAAILLASRFKGLANQVKNSQGQVWSMAKSALVEKKRAQEKDILAWISNHPEHRDAKSAYRELEESVREARQTTWERDFLLLQTRLEPRNLAVAVHLTRWALEREKPDMERHPVYQERRRERLIQEQKREQKRLHLPTEARMLEDILSRLAALGEEQRVAAVDTLLGEDRSAAAIRRAVEKLVRETKIYDLEERLAIFHENIDEIRARRDPLLDFALSFQDDLFEMEKRQETRAGAHTRLRPPFRKAAQAYRKSPLDSDANGTLRVSLAHVRGYRPRDGVWMEPRTRIDGLLEKHTGEDPFSLPVQVLERASEAALSRWADAELGDVPVCFLATGDTSGGNSGGPILNGRGELVGVNFDRVFENMANDFGYDPAVARNIAVDIRYFLWLLEETGEKDAAAVLLEELGIS